MDRRGSLDDSFNDQALPIPIQIFLWRQVSPFIRPKLGKLHEASCMFCQHAPGHHELKEACKSFEKVLVQNIQFGLSPSLSEAIRSIPRWRLIQASFPHIIHCAASLLHNRKDTNLQNLGAAETKLLYTLHWIILDAAEECADADYEKGIYHASPFYYLFSIPAISLFIYLFAPICHHLKESDFQNYRLENGLKIWQAMWDYQHPDTACFTAHVKPKPRALWTKMLKYPQPQFGDVFLGRKGSNEEVFLGTESPPSQSASVSFSDQAVIRVECRPGDEENNWLSSPKDTIFPETIPEESSSTEEEHFVIFRLPSLPESDAAKESIYTAETSIFHVAMGRNDTSTKSTLTIEQVTAISGSDTKQLRAKPAVIQKMGSSTDKDSVGSIKQQEGVSGVKTQANSQGTGSGIIDICAATFLDVAVLRCLFISQWQEEGVYWALQFYYHRLREISEDASAQQQPRKRSNSLPIPKIEVSLYQSPELKRQESKDFIEVPEVKDVSYLTESPYSGRKQLDDQTSHMRRASEKVKKRMKMADLKAFVETKLLSKSEKTLEKIGRDEPKVLYGQDYHRSLDTGDENLSRPCSAFAKIFEPKSDQDKAKLSSNLVKGKSMPSLRYIGEVQSEKLKQNRSMIMTQPYSLPNPIITVTEHTPTPSPDYMRRQGSIDSQLDAISLQGATLNQERKPSLTRSQTDSNITYAGEEIPEAQGSVCYITKDGDIDYQVVLKAVHFAALRDNVCCTLRVCEVILNLVDLLMDMGVLKQCLRDEAAVSGGVNRSVCVSVSGHGHSHHVYHQGSGKGSKGTEYASPSSDKEPHTFSGGSHKGTAKLQTPHSLIMSCVIRVLKHLGCPHGCADGQRGPPADFLRSQGQNILSKLHRASPRQFSRFLHEMVCNQTISDILDFFHAYVGFCVDPSSLLSPLNQKRSCSKSPDIISQGGYATNFGAGLGGGGSRGIEGQIIANVFKTLVTRLVKSAKELRSQENVALYCDVRQLMTYVKEAHGGVFRRVALSGLLDSANRPHRKEPNMQTTRVVRHVHQNELDDTSDIGTGSCFVMDERGSRKLLFKKRSTSSTCASLLETELGEEISKVSQSPLGNLRRKQHILTPRQSERNLGAVEVTQSSLGPRKSSRFQIGGFVNWFRRDYGRTESINSHDDSASPVEGGFIRQASLHHSYGKSSQKAGSSSQVGQTLQKAKKRMKDQFNKFGFGKMKKKDGSVEETPGSYLSRCNSSELGDRSRESEFVILKERKLVPILPVYNGMLRFSFLLETCQPGSVPDPHLLAAALDLVKCLICLCLWLLSHLASLEV